MVTVCVGKAPSAETPSIFLQLCNTQAEAVPIQKALPVTASAQHTLHRLQELQPCLCTACSLHLCAGAHTILQGGRQTRRAMGLVCSCDNQLHPPVPPLKLARSHGFSDDALGQALSCLAKSSSCHRRGPVGCSLALTLSMYKPPSKKVSSNTLLHL